MIYKQLAELCASIGTTPTNFVKDVLKLSSSKVTAWKNGSIPKSEILIQIADYFGVTVGYLFDGKKSSPSELSEEERDCLSAFRELTRDDQMKYIGRMQATAEQYTPEMKENA